MFAIDLSGKRAWVTGASRGIGRATALALADAGCDVAVGFHQGESEAREVVAAIESRGRKAVLAQGDVAKQADCDAMHKAMVAAIGPIDILVNNAGIHSNNLFQLLEPNDWERVLGTNLMGTVHATRAVTNGMWARKAGRIINVSSVATTGGGRGQANYVASKGAIEALTKNLAVEFASRKITVNCVSPGAINTEIWGDTKTQAIIDRQLVKRLGTPEEIAAWIVMLASSYGAFVTGEVFHLNGGWQRGWEVER